MMKILIVSEYIAPLQAIASVRWTKIAKYIKITHPEAEITVLTNQKDFGASSKQKKDTLLEQDMKMFDNYWQVPQSRGLKIYEAAKRKNAKTVQDVQQKMFEREKDGIVTATKKELLMAVRDGKERIFFNQTMEYLKGKKLDFDVIISTYGPAWTHLVANKIKKRCPKAVWIADFRDPYAKETDSPFAFRRHNSFVRKHCNTADVVTRVVDTLYLNEPDNIEVETITNGYDPMEARPALMPECFDLVFTGTLYGEKTDLSVFFQVLKEMKTEGLLDEKTAHLIYAGGQSEAARAMAEKCGAAEFLIDRGMVSRQKAFELQQKAAILLQLGWNGARDQIMWTGKTYEYMMTGKPIAYAVTGNVPFSLPARNIQRLGGVCYEQCRHEETYLGLKEFIHEKYLEWKKSGNVTIHRDEEYVQQYSYEKIAEHVWKLIQERKCAKYERKTSEKN